MASPCPRCGATKTESVRHGLTYGVFWKMGYHLRRCSFCNRRRLFKRVGGNRPHPDDMTRDELQEQYDRKIAEVGGRMPTDPVTADPAAASPPAEEAGTPAASESATSVSVAEPTEEVDEYDCCPRCGSSLFRRSRRTFFERLLKRRRMARCVRCGHRFSHPV